MNDTPENTEGTDVADRAELSDLEADLARRLQGIATTTVVDAEAWDRIQGRITTTRWRTLPRWPLAAAVAIVVAFGVLVAYRRESDGSVVDTVDERTTTTDHDTSATTDDDGTTTSTTVDIPPGGSDGSGGTGTGTGTGTGSQPGTGPGEPGSGPWAPIGDDTPDVPDDGSGPTTTLGGVEFPGYPAGSIQQDGYTVIMTAHEAQDGWYYMNLWRDQVGGSSLTIYGRRQSDRNCLTINPNYGESGETGLLRWGFARPDAAAVRLTSTTGATATAVVGSEVAPGIRPWVSNRPSGALDRVEALDSSGNVLHTASDTNNIAVC